MSPLDPDPNNILGKGILPPEREALLLARGIIFAEWCAGERVAPFLITSSRPIGPAIANVAQRLRDGITGMAAYRIPTP